LNNTLYFTLKCGVLYNSNKCCTEAQAPSVGSHKAIFAFHAHLIKKKISPLVEGRGACLRDIETCLNAGLEALYLCSSSQNDPGGGQRATGLADVGGA
jgi:hypothetical protein